MKVKVTKDTANNGRGYLTVGKIYELDRFNDRGEGYAKFGGFYGDHGVWVYECFDSPNHGYEYELIYEEELNV